MSSSQQQQQQLRRKFRLRRWPVTFGNPALGTYGGSIVSLHHRSRRNALDVVADGDNLNLEDRIDEQGEISGDDDSSESSSSCDSFSSCSSFDSHEDDDRHNKSQIDDMERIVVMTNVPPHQVPDGVINLVRSHRPFIEQVRIVIGLSPSEEAEQRRKRRIRNRTKAAENNTDATIQEDSRRRSMTWACENEDDTAQVDYSLATSLSAASISNLQERDALKSNDQLTRGARSSSLGDLALKQYNGGHGYSICHESIPEEKKDSSDEGNDKSYLILFVLDSKDSAETFVSDLHHRLYTSLDETETCSVYHTVHVEGEDGVSLLGPLFASSTSPPSPSNQSLSTTTTSSKQQPSKDDHQCPVCLDKMSLDASSSILTTVCNHSFHIGCLAQWQDSPCPVCRFDHSGLNETLSRCHICFNTIGNYVCLICGVISCAKGPSSSHDMTVEGSSSAQIPSQRGHAMQHYEETLHAYALDTETQHVFDFAGGGYVHRLLQNMEDGKIVEGTDPRVMEEAQIEQLLGRNNSEGDGRMPPLSSLERSTIPTYSSSAEDDEAVHRKLEGFAGQYYTLLKSQLEQQRIYYEGRLEAIRRENEDNSKAEQSTSDLISALKQQRHQLEQRCMTLKKKHKKVSDDAMFLKNMNETLEEDKFAFRTQIADAQAQFARANEIKKKRLAPLEKKVNLLMLQFDSKPAAK
ncbi:BRCA1-associated protein [Skeletonema marinoi]|uniref:BRCA1-associated protein n=1 Tax=Skeletonema marinoi TaxID=267567 RepID=A0AAD8YBJ8_9STRA|nr:BRCA1-associated protein [Skeletonema marinoi]